MLTFCVKCGGKQTASITSCPRCGFAVGERRKIDPFERTQIESNKQGSSDESDWYLYDFEEDVSLSVRTYFALTNPWRKRWRRGLLWRIALVVMALALLSVLGCGSFLIWGELTKVEVNNLNRTISLYPTLEYRCQIMRIREVEAAHLEHWCWQFDPLK